MEHLTVWASWNVKQISRPRTRLEIGAEPTILAVAHYEKCYLNK